MVSSPDLREAPDLLTALAATVEQAIEVEPGRPTSPRRHPAADRPDRHGRRPRPAVLLGL